MSLKRQEKFKKKYRKVTVSQNKDKYINLKPLLLFAITFAVIILGTIAFMRPTVQSNIVTLVKNDLVIQGKIYQYTKLGEYTFAKPTTITIEITNFNSPTNDGIFFVISSDDDTNELLITENKVLSIGLSSTNEYTFKMSPTSSESTTIKLHLYITYEK